MTTWADKKVWTDEELLALPDDSNKYDVLDGELVVSPAGSMSHGLIIMRIMGPLDQFVLANDLGQVLEGQSGFRMTNDDLLAPDISFIARDRWMSQVKTGKTFFAGAPDLLVEVLSPSDRPGTTRKSLARFFENGARLAWIVQPRSRQVLVYHGPTADRLLTISDALDAEDLVPGFKLALSDVFR